MPAFEYNQNERNRPFVHTNVAGDVTKQSAADSMAEQGMPSGAKLRKLAKKLAMTRKPVLGNRHYSSRRYWLLLTS